MYVFKVFKRSGGISKRNKKSPKPKRASFATTTPIDIPSVTPNTVPVGAETELLKAQTPPTDTEKTHEPEEVKQGEGQQELDQQLQDRVPSDSLSLNLHGSDLQEPTRYCTHFQTGNHVSLYCDKKSDDVISTGGKMLGENMKQSQVFSHIFFPDEMKSFVFLSQYDYTET